MKALTRRELIIGSASGLCGMVAYRYLRRVLRTREVSEFFPDGAEPSYAGSGEDVIAYQFLNDPIWVRSGRRHIEKPTYLDIGAADPVRGNNTYLFYMKGGRGVLVEPNVDCIALLKAKRPEDIVLNVGVGTSGRKEVADYYYYGKYPARNTFNKNLVDERFAQDGLPYKVAKMPLIPINDIIEEHLHGKAPDFLSTDVEGLDLAILKTLDLQRFRPKVICAETIAEDLTRGIQRMSPDITNFLAEKDYEVRGLTYYNTLYIDKHYF